MSEAKKMKAAVYRGGQLRLVTDYPVPRPGKGEALEKVLVQLRHYYLNNYKQMILVIEPGLETMIQTTVDVMDICEKNNILKNLSYSEVELD